MTSAPSELPMAMTAEMVVEQFARMNGAIAEITATLKIIQDGAGAAAKGGWNDEGAANAKTGKNRGIEGKIFENIGVFKGGESEWNGWADDFKIRVDTRCEEAGATLEYLRNLGKPHKEVLPWREVRQKMKEDLELTGLDDLDEMECGRLSKELYRALHMATGDEARLIVKSVDESDGFMAWARLSAKYSQKTLSRVMRLQQECMYPKVAKVEELVGAVLAWEGKWKRMEKEQEKEIKIPAVWKMSALLKLCPREITDMVELRWDEIGEEYERLKDRVIGWATTKAERKGGPVPMDVGEIGDDYYEDENGDWWEIDNVYPAVKCYNCGKNGHIARECPLKGKGKGGGGKGAEKGKGKGGGKGAEKGKGKGPGKGGPGKGGALKGKGKGYQGTCWWCGKVGHKQNECTAWVQDVEDNPDETPIEDCGGLWSVVAGVDEERGDGPGREDEGLSQSRRSFGSSQRGFGVPQRREGPLRFWSSKRAVESPPGLSGRWRQTRVETKNRFGALCEECEVDAVEEEPDVLQAEEWPEIRDAMKIPSRKVRGKMKKMHVGAIEEVNEVEEVTEVDEVVEVTVDSGAARSVWPNKKKGVRRKEIQGAKPKLVAANGTNIEVRGEALLEFDVKGRKCDMKFLDADVKKPLAAVSAMTDAGNTVVFSGKWGSYIENDQTGERIPLEKRGGTYVMVLEARTQKDGKRAENATKRSGKMEIGNMEGDEKGKEASVFRRQAQ